MALKWTLEDYFDIGNYWINFDKFYNMYWSMSNIIGYDENNNQHFLGLTLK